MGTKMTLSARAELSNAVRRRYRTAAGAEKRKILMSSSRRPAITRSQRFER